MADMAALLDEINALMANAGSDLGRLERVLTDGYAHALSLEAERWRLEKRISEVAQGLQRGDTAQKAKELATIAKRLDVNAGALSSLRALLVDLRGVAEQVRVAS
jgi:hypothetical protein